MGPPLADGNNPNPRCFTRSSVAKHRSMTTFVWRAPKQDMINTYLHSTSLPRAHERLSLSAFAAPAIAPVLCLLYDPVPRRHFHLSALSDVLGLPQQLLSPEKISIRELK